MTPEGRPAAAGPVFFRLPPPTDDEVQAVAADAAARSLAVLTRAGNDVDALQHRDDTHLLDQAADESPSGKGTLALAMKASLLDRVAISPRAGHSIERLWRFDPALLDRLYADAEHAEPPREKLRHTKCMLLPKGTQAALGGSQKPHTR